MIPFSWQCQNLCLLGLIFIIDWRVVDITDVASIVCSVEFSVILFLYLYFLPFFACLPCLSHTLRAHPQHKTTRNLDRQRAYKERIRRELNRTLKAEFDRRTCAELSDAVPATETLNVDPQKERAELARQGSLADRQPPASLVQLRQRLNQAGAITAPPQPPQNHNGNAVQFTDAENVRH